MFNNIVWQLQVMQIALSCIRFIYIVCRAAVKRWYTAGVRRKRATVLATRGKYETI